MSRCSTFAEAVPSNRSPRLPQQGLISGAPLALCGNGGTYLVGCVERQLLAVAPKGLDIGVLAESRELGNVKAVLLMPPYIRYRLKPSHVT
jgi:hypothetical protein